MPGAFAHITLVNLAKETKRLKAVPDFPKSVIKWLGYNFIYCELGAVSPDYPYLSINDSQSAKWADLMHYTRSGEMIYAGIAYIKNMEDGLPKRKATAWLLGYVAHMVTDVTIHPIIELKVGVYQDNKTAHRTCEMHQDSYIFQRLNLGGVGICEHFESGIQVCGKDGQIEPEIAKIWAHMLNTVHSANFLDNPPKIESWHKAFNLMVNKIAEEGYKLIPLARHVAVGCGLTYPNQDEIDFQYIHHLATPNGPMSYDDIFDIAVENVVSIWTVIAKAIVSNDTAYKTKVGNWNFDTGRDQNEKLVFWV